MRIPHPLFWRAARTGRRLVEASSADAAPCDCRWARVTMKAFIERRPIWSLIIFVVVAALVWAVFAPWPAGLDRVAGSKKVFLNALFNGITLGALYFLVSSGFTLIFGLMKNVNLAHGSLYMLGGYVGYQTDVEHRLLAAQLRGRLRGGRRARHPAAIFRVPPHGGAGPAADAGDDRHRHRAGRPDAVGLGRRLLPDPGARLAHRPGEDAARHRGQEQRRGRLPDLSGGPAGHLRGLGGARHR